MSEIILGLMVIGGVTAVGGILGYLSTLGKKERVTAENIFGNGLVSLIYIAVLLFVAFIVGGIFI